MNTYIYLSLFLTLSFPRYIYRTHTDVTYTDVTYTDVTYTDATASVLIRIQCVCSYVYIYRSNVQVRVELLSYMCM